MQERTSVPPVHPDECMSTAPPNAPSSPVRWIDGQAIGVLLRLAFSGPPCVPARLADSAGFRRAAAKKRASACGYEDAGRYSTQNSRSASRIAWIMAYYQDIFSIAIHQNAQPEPPNTHSRFFWQQVGSTPLRCRFARLFVCRRARQSCLLSQAPCASTPLFPLQVAKRFRTPRPLSTLRVRSCGSSFRTTAFERPLAAQMSFPVNEENERMSIAARERTSVPCSPVRLALNGLRPLH